ncbi:MAG: adenylate kinase [Chaenotheca gracillima]|nr:MAG: adenylate kinase [Chaenotheca gracillima]
MKLASFSLLFALFAVAVMAASRQKAVIVSYPSDTPDSVLDEAKDAIKTAGGMVTHEYKLIKAFAATAPAKALESVKALGSKYNAVVEEDQIVSIQGSGSRA